jgi:hypothetical protein
MRTISQMRMSTVSPASIMYFDAARRFSKRAVDLDNRDIYDALDKDGKDAYASELVNSALAAVLTANFAVEAVINELYIERALFPDGSPWFKGLPNDVGKALVDAWENGVERYEVMKKCQVAAELAGKNRIDLGAGSAQKMGLLIDLRNALIHHKPISHEHSKEPHESDDDIERKLNRQFELSCVCGDYLFRWHRCLGAGCANWAYETATVFQRDFFAHLGTDYVFKPTMA